MIIVFSKKACTGAKTAHGPPCRCTNADGSMSLNSKPETKPQEQIRTISPKLFGTIYWDTPIYNNVNKRHPMWLYHFYTPSRLQNAMQCQNTQHCKSFQHRFIHEMDVLSILSQIAHTLWPSSEHIQPNVGAPDNFTDILKFLIVVWRRGTRSFSHCIWLPGCFSSVERIMTDGNFVGKCNPSFAANNAQSVVLPNIFSIARKVYITSYFEVIMNIIFIHQLYVQLSKKGICLPWIWSLCASCLNSSLRGRAQIPKKEVKISFYSGEETFNATMSISRLKSTIR